MASRLRCRHILCSGSIVESISKIQRIHRQIIFPGLQLCSPVFLHLAPAESLSTDKPEPRKIYDSIAPVINESLHRQALSAQQSIPKLHQLWLRKKQKITPVRYFRLSIIYRSRGFRPRSCYALIGNIPSGRPEQDMFSENLEILLLRGGMHMDTPDKSTLAKYLMLTYFNKYTYEKVVISKEDYLALTEKIRRKYPVPKS